MRTKKIWDAYIFNKSKTHKSVFTLEATKVIMNLNLKRNQPLKIEQSQRVALFFDTSRTNTFTSDTFS